MDGTGSVSTNRLEIELGVLEEVKLGAAFEIELGAAKLR